MVLAERLGHVLLLNGNHVAPAHQARRHHDLLGRLFLVAHDIDRFQPKQRLLPHRQADGQHRQEAQKLEKAMRPAPFLRAPDRLHAGLGRGLRVPALAVLRVQVVVGIFAVGFKLLVFDFRGALFSGAFAHVCSSLGLHAFPADIRAKRV